MRKLFFAIGVLLVLITIPAVYAAVCTDNDGGRNYFVRGTTTDDDSSYTDYCDEDAKTLSEYLCSDKNIAYEGFYTCRFGCVNGLCNKQNGEYFGCIDTDGGYNTFEKGTVTSAGGVTYNDYCDTYYKSKINEYMCVDYGSVYTSPYTCPYGCIIVASIWTSIWRCVNTTIIYTHIFINFTLIISITIIIVSDTPSTCHSSFFKSIITTISINASKIFSILFIA